MFILMENENFTFDIYNTVGSKVYSEQIKSQSIILKKNRLPTGQYILKVTGTQYNSTQKLIVKNEI